MRVSECGCHIRTEHLRLKEALLGPAITVETTVTLKDALHICHAHLCVCACARVSVFVYVLCVRVCVCVQAHVLVCARQRVCAPDNEANKVRDGAHSSKRERETDRETVRQRETESIRWYILSAMNRVSCECVY